MEIYPACGFNGLNDFPARSILGEKVLIFDEKMDMKLVQSVIDSVFELQGGKNNEFTDSRFALLFTPGEYDLDIPVGYYTQVLGLGRLPQDVLIRGEVHSNAGSRGHVLTNFWRSVENLSIEPLNDSVNTWGVSQAAPIRSVIVHGNLNLFDRGYSSGGFMADCMIEGEVQFGSQQQWFSRNSSWESCSRGSWNIFSLGVNGAPTTTYPDGQFTSLDSTPVSRSKPFLFASRGELKFMVPEVQKKSKGPSWNQPVLAGREIPLSEFYIARPENDNAKTLNMALQNGKHVLFTPGIYHIENPLRIVKEATIMAGIGMPSLVAKNQDAVIIVEKSDGIILSGLLLDAGMDSTNVLLKLGETPEEQSILHEPSWCYDIFCRVGGPGAASVNQCVVVNSNDVFMDNMWIWRADHGNGVGWDTNRSQNGIVVNGNRVTVYGLFNEHHQGYQAIWNGNNGQVFMYQSEMPYDPPSVDAWRNGEKGGFPSYIVSEDVTSHEAWGVGVYCVFYNAPVQVDCAVETPGILEDSIHHKFTVWLGGNPESILHHIINDKGKSVSVENRKSTLE